LGCLAVGAKYSGQGLLRFAGSGWLVQHGCRGWPRRRPADVRRIHPHELLIYAPDTPHSTSLMRLIITLIAVALLTCLWDETTHAAGREHTRVLLLHSNDLMLPGVALQDRITREAISSALGGSVDFYSEAFDRFRVPGQQDLFVAHLHNKYALQPPHLIVAHGSMLEIVRQRSGTLWPGVPLMLADVASYRIIQDGIPLGIPYTSVQMDVLGTVQLALQLQPATRKVLVVAGAASYDRDASARAMRELEALAPRIAIEELAQMSADQMNAAMSALQEGTIVVYLTVHKDTTGNTFVPRDFLKVLSRNTAVPIYSFYDTFIGHGIVGGKLMNREAQSRAIGGIALRLLRGEPSSGVPIPTPSLGVCTVDWREIQRWNIDPRRIPQECRVMFREASFWERHRVLLTAAVLALFLQIAWVIAWLIQRQRRRAAESAARLRIADLTHTGRLGTMGGLMASITHEISQPLMSILTNARAGERLIASGQLDVEEIRSILADIRSDDARAGALISHLREFLKKRELSMESIDINELVSKALRIINTAARTQQIDVVAVLDEKLGMVFGDPIHLQQVVLNLAVNGMEAITAGPAVYRSLTVRTSLRSAQEVEITVSDTGCGIPHDQLARLFEPFYSTKPDGMGIGLAIAQIIVHAHGGRIWAESSDGRTDMRFTLPVRAERRPQSEEAALRV
jgi:signal transduction histidine kinase